MLRSRRQTLLTRLAQVSLDIEYHKTMLELNLRVTPKDVLVGWYSTGAAVVAADAVLHNFFGDGAPNGALHLAVDTRFLDPDRAVRAWVGAPVALRGAVLGTSFVAVRLSFAFAEAERAGLPLLSATSPAPLPSDTAGLNAGLARLHALLELGAEYASAVAAGRARADPQLGRALSEAVHAVPRLSKAAVEGMFADAVQDVLLVMFLSNITRTQLVLADKLNTPLNV